MANPSSQEVHIPLAVRVLLPGETVSINDPNVVYVQGAAGPQGPPGPPGPAGIGERGPQGFVGDTGPSGANLLIGNGPPTSDVGNNSDTYFDGLNRIIYGAKTNGAWPASGTSLVGPVGPCGPAGLDSTVPGPVGPSGRDGFDVLAGYGPPGDTLGSDGDQYFSQQNGAIYGPKQNGQWPSTFRSLIGPAGVGGEAGTKIYAANGAPSDSQGVEGDFFFSTAARTLFGPKGPDGSTVTAPDGSTAGPWGFGYSLVGLQGQAGQNGATILAGEGVPSSSAGDDGDYWLDQRSATLVGPKAGGAWPATGLELVGPQGQPGSTIHASQTSPDNTVGQGGDYWLDQSSATLFGPRTNGPAGFYQGPGVNLLGPQGPVGSPGAQGARGASGAALLVAQGDPAPTDGSDGDSFFNSTSGYFFGPKAQGQWPAGVLLKGPAGDIGPQGASIVGPQGPGFLYGAADPQDAIGTDGSFYVCTTNWHVYGPKQGGTWFTNNGVAPSVSLVGPQGPAGADSTVPGPTGPQGSSTRTGHGQPTSDIGADGDLFIDLDAAALWGPKKSGGWPGPPVSLLGPAGAAGASGPAGADSTVPGPPGQDGATILTGSASPPTADVGNDGDIYVSLTDSVLWGPKQSGAWPASGTNLIGAQGPEGEPGQPGSPGSILRYGNGAPTAATYANDGDFFIDQAGSRLFGPRQSGTWPSSYVNLVGPTGADGSIIRTGQGAPDASVGYTGDVYIDLSAGNLWGNKTADGWPSAYTVLKGDNGDVGPQGPAGPLLNDFSANSFVAAPIAGDTNPTTLAVSNGSAQVFVADISGDVTAAGAVSVGASLTVSGAASAQSLSVGQNATVGGDASVSGTVTASRFLASSAGSAGAPLVGYTGAFQGQGTSASSGLYSEGTFGQWYEVVGGYTARSITYTVGPPRDYGANTVTHNAYTNVSGTNAAHRWYVGGGALALQILGNGAVQANGGLSVAGALSGAAATFTGALSASSLTLSQGGLTFPDGTSLTTATAPNQASYTATQPGSAAAPAFGYTGGSSPAGLYFDGAGRTYVAGALSASSASVTGNVTAGALALSQGGALTFADGTSMSTAATGSGGSGGTSSNIFPSGIDVTGGGVTFADGTVQNTAAQVAPVITNVANTCGPSAQFAGQSIPTGLQQCYFAGTTIPYVFTPQASSALMGASIVNYAATGAALTVSLNDLTAGTTVVNIGSLATSATAYSYGFTSTQYPLTAGHQYAWMVQRATAGVASIQINPQYLMPAATPSSLSVFAPFVISTSTTATNGGTVNFAPPGLTGQISYYRNANASYLYYIELYVAGSGTGAPYIFNTTAGANQYAAGNITLTSTLTRYTYGPFSAASWPFVAQSSYRFGIYVPTGGTATVTQGYASITVGM